jgi:WD40 repeat protein
LLSLNTGIKYFRGHDSTVNKIVCGPSNYLFSVAYDKKAKSWDSNTGECLNTFEGHERNVPMLLFVPSKPGQYKKQAYVKNEVRKTIASKLKTHLDEEEALGEDVIITGSYDSLAKSWSIQSAECIHTFKGHTGALTCMTTDFTNKLLFTGSSDHTIRSWEIATGNSLKVFEGHTSTIIAISV